MRELLNKNREKFDEECKVIDLYIEYGENYTGKERFGLITSLSEQELNEKYPDLIMKYIPYIILSEDFGDARLEYIRNNDKFRKRQSRSYGVSLSSDYVDYNKELWSHSAERECIYDETLNKIQDSLKELTDLQREVIIMNIFEGKSRRQIARDFMKCEATVRNIYNRAILNMRKNLSINFSEIKNPDCIYKTSEILN